jgi:hypothetical protein
MTEAGFLHALPAAAINSERRWPVSWPNTPGFPSRFYSLRFGMAANPD